MNTETLSCSGCYGSFYIWLCWMTWPVHCCFAHSSSKSSRQCEQHGGVLVLLGYLSIYNEFHCCNTACFAVHHNPYYFVVHARLQRYVYQLEQQYTQQFFLSEVSNYGNKVCPPLDTTRRSMIGWFVIPVQSPLINVIPWLVRIFIMDDVFIFTTTRSSSNTVPFIGFLPRCILRLTTSTNRLHGLHEVPAYRYIQYCRICE